MKRKLTALLLVSVMLLSLAGCKQEPQEFSLKGINITLTAPGNLKAFTRDMPEDAKVLEEYDTNSQGVDRGLRDRTSYLYLFDKDMNFGLDVCCMLSRTEDYKSLSSEDREQLVWEYKASLQGSTEVYDVAIRELGAEVYAYMHYNMNGTHYWRWATNRDDRLYYMTLTSADPSLGEQQLSWIEEMISGIAYN